MNRLGLAEYDLIEKLTPLQIKTIKEESLLLNQSACYLRVEVYWDSYIEDLNVDLTWYDEEDDHVASASEKVYKVLKEYCKNGKQYYSIIFMDHLCFKSVEEV